MGVAPGFPKDPGEGNREFNIIREQFADLYRHKSRIQV